MKEKDGGRRRKILYWFIAMLTCEHSSRKKNIRKYFDPSWRNVWNFNDRVSEVCRYLIGRFKPVQQFAVFARRRFHSASLFAANTRWILITLFAIAQRRRGGERGRKKGAKSAFVCGLRNRKKRQFTLFLAPPPSHVHAGLHMYVCALDP